MNAYSPKYRQEQRRAASHHCGSSFTEPGRKPNRPAFVSRGLNIIYSYSQMLPQLRRPSGLQAGITE